MENRFKVGDEVWIKTRVIRAPRDGDAGFPLYLLGADGETIRIGVDRLNAVALPEGWSLTSIKKS